MAATCAHGNSLLIARTAFEIALRGDWEARLQDVYPSSTSLRAIAASRGRHAAARRLLSVAQRRIEDIYAVAHAFTYAHNSGVLLDLKQLIMNRGQGSENYLNERGNSESGRAPLPYEKSGFAPGEVRGPERDLIYLAWIRTLACVVCGQPPSASTPIEDAHTDILGYCWTVIEVSGRRRVEGATQRIVARLGGSRTVRLTW